MVRNINRDHTRFKSIVKGKIKKDLRKYISYPGLIGKKGKEIVSIPVPQIDIPNFRYNNRDVGGVGSGEGNAGTPIGIGQGEKGEGAGNQPGGHIPEVDISLDEFVKTIFEELELPRIEPKGKKKIIHEHHRYDSIAAVGPRSLIHFKRSYKEALKHSVGFDGKIDFKKQISLTGSRGITRFKDFKTIEEPESNAVIFYMMDYSGSMEDEQKEIVRTEAFWIDTWLRKQYSGVEVLYILHDAVAIEVGQHKFYNEKSGGGTIISSSYKLCNKIIDERFNPNEWNIYPFHFSDGDNFGEDNTACLNLLRNEVLPKVNQFCYGQVKSPYGSGAFYELLKPLSEENDRLVISKIEDREGIYDSIKEFLGKGK
ncbi:DUF444 family protein [Candidatus Woesearchaeota archaeon]|nr:DUF444 family protein [Candidatus Woesearchaeota archaeon]